jgi:t-SNARE complex subunit (syntaxin)
MLLKEINEEIISDKEEEVNKNVLQNNSNQNISINDIGNNESSNKNKKVLFFIVVAGIIVIILFIAFLIFKRIKKYWY